MSQRHSVCAKGNWLDIPPRASKLNAAESRTLSTSNVSAHCQVRHSQRRICMKRLALVAIIVAAAACSKSDQTQMADTTTPAMAPAPMDTGMKMDTTKMMDTTKKMDTTKTKTGTKSKTP